MTGLGTWLIEAREARGLTLEDAERDTRISRRYLQALEEETFTVIPAPVYARGFLRSYFQYLGLDPQEAMARYPRDEDAYAPPVTQPVPAGRPPARQTRPRPTPPSEGGAGRPTWKRPTPIRTGEGVVPAPAQSNEAGGYEPMIGVDIGVPVQTRRLDRDPAAQTRTMTVVVVAIAAIALVLLLAFFLSRAGGDDGAGVIPDGSDSANSGDGDGSGDGTDDGDDADPTDVPSTAQQGIVPGLVGLSQEAAAAEIRAAGFEPNVRLVPSNEPAGTVTDQQPAEGLEHAAGSPVTILVSEGPQ